MQKGSKMKKCLRFDMIEQYFSGVSGHPQDIMKELGIKYEHAIPQSIGDQWWFIDCEYDCILPKFIDEMEFTEEDRKHWL
jgi:hypothetical protein